MRISKEKSLDRPIGIMPPLITPSVAARKKELIALVQAGLRVGADLSARETGRRALSEYVKLEADASVGEGVSASAPEHILFTYPSRRKARPS